MFYHNFAHDYYYFQWIKIAQRNGLWMASEVWGIGTHYTAQIIEGHMISHMINHMTSNVGTDLVRFGYVDIDEAIATGI